MITLVGERTGPVLRATSERLRTACIATARQDAELLLARVTGRSRLELHLEPERSVDPAALDRLEALVRRRVCHEPLQYILGEAEFHGLRVAVGPGVFIPRPETELLVERALAVSGDAARTAVDLCTGSGAVACALAAAIDIAKLGNTVILSAGTDGTDGPTEAAGAIADGHTINRALERGLDARKYLARNDSFHFFEPLGDLLITGPTNTNVMDVRLVLVGR